MYIKNNNNLGFINPLVSEWELPNPYKEYQKLVDDAKLEGLKAQQKYDWMPITSQALQSLASVLGGINSASGGGSNKSSSSLTSTSATSPYSSTLNLKMPGIKMPTSLLQGALGMPNQMPMNLEAEGGEVYEDSYGNMQEIQGPSHEQGGVNMQVDPLAELYSNRIKIDGLTIADRVKKRAKRNATLEDLLKADPTNSIVKKSWERSQENDKNLKEIEKRLQAEIQKQLNRF